MPRSSGPAVHGKSGLLPRGRDEVFGHGGAVGRHGRSRVCSRGVLTDTAWLGHGVRATQVLLLWQPRDAAFKPAKRALQGCKLGQSQVRD